MIWDILVYIPEDVKILRRSPFHLVTICFVLSRYMSLVSERINMINQISRLSALIFVLLGVFELSAAFLYTPFCILAHILRQKLTR